MSELQADTTFQTFPEEEQKLTSYISRVMRVDEVTWGDPKKGYIVRYRGQLHRDSAEAYENLSTDLRPLDITPLFRNENNRHAIILIDGIVKPRPSKVWVNGVLFIFTIFSVLIAGTIYAYDGPISSDLSQTISSLLSNLKLGIPFAISLLAILLAHEFGHYLAGRYHRTAVTLPYFIPFPLSLFGTMGAFIQLKEPPKNKRILLDIGIAGPLAGLVVAIPVTILGLYLSTVNKIPFDIPPGQGFEGNSILYLGLKYLVHGQWLPQPVSYNGMNPLFFWARYMFTGIPLPRGGLNVTLNPIAWAGWAGLLVTSFNMIPIGQLDGGHVIYSLIGKRASRLLPFVLVALILLGMVWAGWWLWAFLILLLGRIFAEPLDQITQLDPNRKLLAIFGLIIFFLVFIPVPLIEVFGGL
jgi:membrane-associated protease RseP (regulator of RpoE activity)